MTEFPTIIGSINSIRQMRYRILKNKISDLRIVRLLENKNIDIEYDNEIARKNIISFILNAGFDSDYLSGIEQHYQSTNRDDRYFICFENTISSGVEGQTKVNELRSNTRIVGKNRYFFAPDKESLTILMMYWYPIVCIYDFHEERCLKGFTKGVKRNT